MGTTSELTWGRLHVEAYERSSTPGYMSPLEIPRIRVYGYTASEQARHMTLSKTDLVNLLVDAAEALRTLEIAEANARAGR